MKTAFRCLASVVAVGALLAVAGCNTVSTRQVQYVGAPHYGPSNPATIEILRTPPTRAHVRLGEVTAEPSGDSVPVTQIEEALRNSAAKLGADALVIVADRTQVTGAVVSGPWWARSVDQVTGRVIMGVAIKYSGP